MGSAVKITSAEMTIAGSLSEPHFGFEERAPLRGDRTPLERQNHPCVSLEIAALNELVAQLVEQRPFKAWVVRSNRTELTTPGRVPQLRIVKKYPLGSNLGK
jgi:hypothetical protein